MSTRKQDSKPKPTRKPEALLLLLFLLFLTLVVYFQSTRDIFDIGTLERTSKQTTPPAPQASQPYIGDRTEALVAKPIVPTPKAKPLSARGPQYAGTGFEQTAGDYPFYVTEKIWEPERKRYRFMRKGMHGKEVPITQNVRRHFLSENQRDYPEPESGCGPTALLNLYIWYSKFGLLKESIRHSDPTKYKQLKFRQIDKKLLNIQQQSRTRHGGTNTLTAIVAMDELFKEYAPRTTRLHFEIKHPPLTNADFRKLAKGFRAGILSVRPKDPDTGELMGHHAVLCLHGDNDGVVTIANWGEFSNGRIVQRSDGQWFVPVNGKDYEMRINSLTTLIPFLPEE